MSLTSVSDIPTLERQKEARPQVVGWHPTRGLPVYTECNLQLEKKLIVARKSFDHAVSTL